MTIAERKQDIERREKLLAKVLQAKADGTQRVREIEARRRNLAVAAAVEGGADVSEQLTHIEKELDKAKNDLEREKLAAEGIEGALVSLKQSLVRAEFEEVRTAAVNRIYSIMAAKREERLNALLDEIVLIFDELRAEYAGAYSAALAFWPKANERSLRNLQSLAERHANLMIHQLADRCQLAWVLDRDEMIRARKKDIYSEALLALDALSQELRSLKPPAEAA